MKKTNNVFRAVLKLAIGIAAGISLGFWIVYMDNELMEVSMSRIMACMMGGIYLSMLVQIILHEGGHLIAGLMTGYRFVSFRVMNRIWVKQNGKIVRKRYSLSGTGGQCLLDPPGTRFDYPAVFYNLGGVIMNLLMALLGYGMYCLFPHPLAKMVCLEFMAVGIIYALMNGIPLRTSTVNNDGSNTVEILRYPRAKEAMWIQLKLNALQSEGIRLRDMPEELFEMPDEEDMKHSLCASLAAYRMLYLLDIHQFDEALSLLKQAKECPALPGVYGNQLIMDEITMEILQGNTDPALITDAYRNALKVMSTSLTALRTEYAVQNYVYHDETKAKAARKRCQAMMGIWPYASEVQAEEELLAELDRRFTNEYTETGRDTAAAV